MIDIKLDSVTHDIVVENGDLVLIDGVESIVQGLRIRLAVLSGEWYLDNSIGIINANEDRPDADDVSIKVQQEIVKEDGVTRVTEYADDFNAQTRVLSISFKVMTIYGEAKLENGVQL